MNLLHLKYLIYKEFLQINKDKSILIIAFFVPLLLIIIYGFGMNMDIKPIRAAFVSETNSAQVSDLYSKLQGSEYIEIQRLFNHTKAERLLNQHAIDAIIDIKSDFNPAKIKATDEILITVNGVSGITAVTVQNYLQEAISTVLNQSKSTESVKLVSRNWFNDANTSTWYLLPGQMIGIITLVGAFMSSLVIAREINRGTIESLIVSNVSALEVVISKTLTYFFMAFWGAMLTLIFTEIFFAIPIKGSLFFLISTIFFYTLSSVALGLLISAVMKDQFLATEYAIILSFLPAILLSGALFDLRSVPFAITCIGYLLPPTYAVESMRICFLSGGNEAALIKNLAIIIGYSFIFLSISVFLLRKQGIKGVKNV